MQVEVHAQAGAIASGMAQRVWVGRVTVMKLAGQVEPVQSVCQVLRWLELGWRHTERFGAALRL